MFRIRRSCEEHVTINAKGACGETGGPSITLGTWYSPPPRGPRLGLSDSLGHASIRAKRCQQQQSVEGKRSQMEPEDDVRLWGSSND